MDLLKQQVPVARPPWTKLGKKLESLCRKALYEFEMLQGIDKLALALSGGKDSLSLLFLLHAIRGRGFPDFEIYAIHVEGEFSCGAAISENFLRGICKELGVHLEVCESLQKRDELECYSCSRERRRLIFNKAKELGANTIAFGHHRDDSAQTLLMNLLHKGEFASNMPKIPMHDYGVTIIRPLIFVREEDLREFAQLYGFARIVCQCPAGQQSMRKAVKDMLAQMEEFFPNSSSNLAEAGLRYGSKKALKN